MSLPWVKIHVSLLNNREYKRLTPGGKLTFVTCLMLAGDLDSGDYSGRLESESGPVSIDEIGEYTGMRAKLQAEAVTELLNVKLLTQDLLGVFTVEKFKEKAAPLGALSTDRVKRSRERKRNGDETFQERSGNAAEAEAELYASLRSAAIGTFPTFPEDAALLPGLALIFVQRFANCRDPEKAEKHVDQYAVVLGSFARDGYTVAQTWKAFEDAWKANGEKPLFSGKAKNALSFKPGRIAQKHAKANDRGEAMDLAILEKQRRAQAV